MLYSLCLPSVTHSIILWYPFSDIKVSETLQIVSCVILSLPSSHISVVLTASLRGMQEEYQKKALSAFQRWFSDCPKFLSLTYCAHWWNTVSVSLRAQSLSPTDHLAVFYLALQLAVSRQVGESTSAVHTQVVRMKTSHSQMMVFF